MLLWISIIQPYSFYLSFFFYAYVHQPSDNLSYHHSLILSLGPVYFYTYLLYSFFYGFLGYPCQSKPSFSLDISFFISHSDTPLRTLTPLSPLFAYVQLMFIVVCRYLFFFLLCVSLRLSIYLSLYLSVSLSLFRSLLLSRLLIIMFVALPCSLPIGASAHWLNIHLLFSHHLTLYRRSRLCNFRTDFIVKFYCGILGKLSSKTAINACSIAFC